MAIETLLATWFRALRVRASASAMHQRTCLCYVDAGKGRTGMMVAALMLKLGEFDTGEDSLKYFGYARTKNSKVQTGPVTKISSSAE